MWLLKFLRKASSVEPAAVAAMPTYEHADQLAKLAEQSNAAKAEESSMSTSAVVPEVASAPAAPAAATPHVSLIKRFGSLFAHGFKGAISLIAKEEKPIENIALVAGTLAGVGPEVQAVENTFNLMFGEVVKVEQVATAVGASSGNGLQKLAVAIPQVEAIILSDPLFKGKQITDLDKWNKAVASIAGSLYDLGNSVAAPDAPGTASVVAK